MAQLTVVSVGERTLGVVSGRSVPTGVELTRSASAPLPDDFLQKPPAERGTAVREALAALGGGDRRIALVLPRAAAVLREFDLPAGQPEEVLQMVRFQLEKELPLPLDQVRWSYMTAPLADGKLHVSAVAIPIEALEIWTRAFEEAGCSVAAVYVSSFGLANLVPDGDGGAALVSLAGPTAEFLVVDGRALAFSRSVPLKDAAEDLMATELSRTILSWNAKAGGREIRRVLVAGEDAQAEKLSADLARALGRDVARLALNGDISRKSGVAVGMETAAAAGVVVGFLRGSAALPDILRPPVAPKRFRLSPKQRAAILAALALVMGFVWAESWLSQQESDVDSLRKEVAGLKPRYDEVVRLRENTRLVNRWYGDRGTWLKTLEILRTKIDPKKLYLLSASFDDAGPVTLQGKCVDRAAVNDLINELTKAKLVRDAKATWNDSSDAKSQYKTNFSITATLASVEPAGKGKR